MATPGAARWRSDAPVPCPKPLDCGTAERSDAPVLRRFNAGPAVLLELGFLTNSGDLAALLDEERRPRACRRLALVLSQSSSG
jgi:N-acetylmuramoyl-L-alanine amidase